MLGFSLLMLLFPLNWVQRVLTCLHISDFSVHCPVCRHSILSSALLKESCGPLPISGSLLGPDLDCKIIFLIGKCS